MVSLLAKSVEGAGCHLSEVQTGFTMLFIGRLLELNAGIQFNHKRLKSKYIFPEWLLKCISYT
jgi:hypothetical protein